MSEELIIDEKNFEQYFFDVRRFAPKRGQIMARFMAKADFIDGMMKKNIIDLLQKDKALAAVQVMRKLGCATDQDAIKICKEVCEDLIAGMTDEEVENKVYRYTMESFYYTKKEYVPLDDPHWSLISVKNLDEFLDADKNKCKMTTKVVDSLDEKKQNE